MISNYDLTEPVPTGPARISYPFEAEGDRDSMILEQDYYVYATSYKPAVLNDELNTDRDLKQPFSPTVEIPQMFRMPDVKKGVTKKILNFKKVWANLPANRTNVFSGSTTFPFPSFQVVVYTPPASADAAENSENLYKFVETRGANGSPAPLYIDYTYFFKASPPTTIPEVFRPTYGGNGVDFVTDGGSGSFSGTKALNGETFNAIYTVGATTPTLTQYIAKITSEELLVIDVQIERYMGDIYQMKTLKMKAK